MDSTEENDAPLIGILVQRKKKMMLHQFFIEYVTLTFFNK